MLQGTSAEEDISPMEWFLPDQRYRESVKTVVSHFIEENRRNR